MMSSGSGWRIKVRYECPRHLTSRLIHSVNSVKEVISVACKNPVDAWELLKKERYANHPQRARLICRVCRAALRMGMAQEVRR